MNSDSDVYLGEVPSINSVEGDFWFADIAVIFSRWRGQKIRFKLNTGAALSVCGPSHCTGDVKPTKKTLRGPGNTSLTCVEVISSEL